MSCMQHARNHAGIGSACSRPAPVIEDSGTQLPAGWGPKIPPVGSSPSPSCAPCPYYASAAAGSGICMPCPSQAYWRNAASPGKCSNCPKPKTACPVDVTLAINTKNWIGTYFPAGCCYSACIGGNRICDNAPDFPFCECTRRSMASLFNAGLA